MRKIRTRADIEFLIDTFYKNVLADRTIGYFFTEVEKLDWERHIPLMIDFWETVLFGNFKYKGNPMLVHMQLNKKEPLRHEHFKQWIQLWETTISEHFMGEIAIKAVDKAKTIGEVMMMRIIQSETKSEFNLR